MNDPVTVTARHTIESPPSFKMILDVMPHAVLLLERDGSVVYMNRSGSEAIHVDLMLGKVGEVFPLFPDITRDMPSK